VSENAGQYGASHCGRPLLFFTLVDLESLYFLPLHLVEGQVTPTYRARYEQ